MMWSLCEDEQWWRWINLCSHGRLYDEVDDDVVYICGDLVCFFLMWHFQIWHQNEKLDTLVDHLSLEITNRSYIIIAAFYNRSLHEFFPMVKYPVNTLRNTCEMNINAITFDGVSKWNRTALNASECWKCICNYYSSQNITAKWTILPSDKEHMWLFEMLVLLKNVLFNNIFGCEIITLNS